MTEPRDPYANEEPIDRLAPVTIRPASKRAWDADHPTTAFRLSQETVDRLRQIQRWHKDRGHRVSLSQLADDLLWAGADAWDKGQVSVTTRPISQTTREVTRNPHSDDISVSGNGGGMESG